MAACALQEAGYPLLHHQGVLPRENLSEMPWCLFTPWCFFGTVVVFDTAAFFGTVVFFGTMCKKQGIPYCIITVSPCEMFSPGLVFRHRDVFRSTAFIRSLQSMPLRTTWRTAVCTAWCLAMMRPQAYCRVHPMAAMRLQTHCRVCLHQLFPRHESPGALPSSKQGLATFG